MNILMGKVEITIAALAMAAIIAGIAGAVVATSIEIFKEKRRKKGAEKVNGSR